MSEQVATGDPNKSHLFKVSVTCLFCGERMREQRPDPGGRNTADYECPSCSVRVAVSMEEVEPK
jgi:DNA-directed RNA polymerase subunit RPC12/RpoP